MLCLCDVTRFHEDLILLPPLPLHDEFLYLQHDSFICVTCVCQRERMNDCLQVYVRVHVFMHARMHMHKHAGVSARVSVSTLPM